MVVTRGERDVDCASAGQLDSRFVTVVGRVEDDDLVTRPYRRGDRTEDALGCSRDNSDLAVWVSDDGPMKGKLACHGFSQRGQPCHWCVLVGTGFGSVSQRLYQCGWWVKVWETL